MNRQASGATVDCSTANRLRVLVASSELKYLADDPYKFSARPR